MSDFNDLCNVFDKIGLLYDVDTENDIRFLHIFKDQPKSNYLGCGYAWFEFDNFGNFLKFSIEE